MAEITLNINTFEDQNDGGDFQGLSLRDAILIANADPGNKYIINLEAGTYDLTIKNVLLPPGVDDTTVDLPTLIQSRLSTGDLDVSGNVTIVGVSPEETIIDAEDLQFDDFLQPLALGDRIFDVLAGGTLVLENITIQNGIILDNPTTIDPDTGAVIELAGGNIDTVPNGGALNVEAGASVTVRNSVITDSTSDTQGGGINNAGTLEIIESTISNHRSGDNAGGIYNTGNLIIQKSLLTNNFADSAAPSIIEGGGGGILNEAGASLSIINSTLSGNTSNLDGGGAILSRGSTSIISSTIVDNTAQVGSAIWSETASARTILTNNVIGQSDTSRYLIPGMSPDLDGFFDPRSSYNLASNAGGAVLDGNNNNIVGNDTNPIELSIGPLNDNGGPTLTHALLSDSPALDAGNNNIISIGALFPNSPPRDQRGSERISNGTVDLGSYELFVANDSTNNVEDNSSQVSDDNNNSSEQQNDNDNTNTDTSVVGVNENSNNSVGNVNSNPLDTPIFRFQNTSVSGTYLYAGQEESNNIRSNFPEFVEEGFAFNVAVEPGDDLIALYRFQNLSVPGTYLYAGAQERQSILQNNTNFVEEGIAFYVYGADADRGQDIYRFQNISLPGTYIFVGQAEKDAILQNNTNFVLEGVAFEVSA